MPYTRRGQHAEILDAAEDCTGDVRGKDRIGRSGSKSGVPCVIQSAYFSLEAQAVDETVGQRSNRVSDIEAQCSCWVRTIRETGSQA